MGEEVTVQIPAGILHLFAIDVVIGGLGPIGRGIRIGISHRPACGLVELAVQNLPLQAKEALIVGFDGWPGPAGASRLPTFIHHRVHNHGAGITQEQLITSVGQS